MKTFKAQNPNLFIAIFFTLGSAVTPFTLVVPFITTFYSGALVVEAASP